MTEDGLRQAAAGMQTNGISPEELDNKEARFEDRGAHLTGKSLRQAAAGTQSNGISSEGLEDGELEEEPEVYANGDLNETSHVKGQRKQYSFQHGLFVIRNPRQLSLNQRNK